MKRNILITLILMLCVLFAQGKTRKAIFIIVDGVPADCVERLQPPTLSAIAQEGGYSRGYCGGAQRQGQRQHTSQLQLPHPVPHC